MAERRYSFRFSLPEGCVILLSLLLTSFLVFLFGVYVGKEVEAHKAAQQTRTARLPVSVSGEPSRPVLDPPATTSTAPAEKSEAPTALPNSSTSPALRNQPAPPNATVAMGQKTSPSVLPKPEASVAAGPKPQPDSSSTPAAIAPVAPKSSSPSASAAVAMASKPRSDPPSTPTASASVTPKPSLPSTSTATVVAPKPKPSSLASSITVAPPVKAVGSEFDSREKKSPASSNRWTVQVQATTQEMAAQNIAKQLREQGLSPVVSKVERQGEVWYRVRIGRFANEEEAQAVVSRFRREGKFTQAYPVLE